MPYLGVMWKTYLGSRVSLVELWRIRGVMRTHHSKNKVERKSPRAMLYLVMEITRVDGLGWRVWSLLVQVDKLVEPAVLLVAVIVTDNRVDAVAAFVESTLAIDEPGVDLARVCHPADATSVTTAAKSPHQLSICAAGQGWVGMKTGMP